MTLNRRYLPSLGSLATFEVAAKHLSFTLAATELNVTQAAISQQIRNLEKALDVTLFLRKHNGLELSAAGITLLRAVSRGLDNLCDGIETVISPASSTAITCAGTNAVAAFFFKPYIDRFRAEYPETRFILLSSDEDDSLRNHADVDLSILCGNERCNMGEKLIYLFPETVQPMCSPDYLRQHGPFETPSSLIGTKRLELHGKHWSDNAIGWQPYTWENWFRAMGIALPPPEPAFSCNNYPLLLEAAANGEGVVIGWGHLVRPFLETARLCRLMERPLEVGRGYYLKLNPATMDQPHVQAFVDFILTDIATFKRRPEI